MFRSRLALPALLLIIAAALFWLLEWIGGATYPLDVAAIRGGVGWRAAHPKLTDILIHYTHFGSVYALLGMTAAASLWLWLERERLRVAFLLSTVIGGRIGIELIKLFVDRPRPSFDAHPVVVHSQSFPSGHAGNSMLTFLALALFVTPDRWRPLAVTVAVAASLLMGITRPLLGVHWPSDVLAGWLYGATLSLMAWAFFRQRSEESAA